MIRSLTWGAVALATCLAASPAAAQNPFPTRPLTIVVAAGAGGGGDTTTRILARELEKTLGQPITIINQGQGGGVVGLTNLIRARPDGYTVGLLFPYAGYKYVGQADFKASDFTPLGNFNGDSAALLVNAASPFKDFKQALEALKAEPGKYTIHCSGACGSVWDIPVAGMLLDAGVDVARIRWVPGQGAASGMTELASGGVDFQTASLPEAASLMGAGHIRALAVLSPGAVPGFEQVPLAGDTLGKPLDGGTWRALAGPAGLPDDVARQWEDAMRRAVESDAFKAAMKQANFGVKWQDRTQLAGTMRQHETDTARVMQALGYGSTAAK